MAKDEQTKAAEKAAAEKEKTQAAKDLLNVPAPPRNAAATQANGNNNQSVTFDLPSNLPPAPGNKPTILHGLRNLSDEKLSLRLFVILNEAKKGDKS